MSRRDVPGEGYVCLGCEVDYRSEQARLDCEARHVEEELLACGVYPEWLAGFGPPDPMYQEAYLGDLGL